MQLMMKVQQIFDDSAQCFGAEKIRIVLANSGIRTSKDRIAAIMKELDLHSVRTDAKKQYQKRQERKRNLLQRKFSAERPNQIWVSDITSFKVNDYRLYVCIMLDLYSRKIVAFRVSRNITTRLVTKTFREAYENRGNPQNLIFHSDRGTQYTSEALTNLLNGNGVQQSFSGVGQPLDNAVAEAFFATFKKEEAYRREYTSEQNFRQSLEQYIQFYNEVRPHQSLKYKTP